MSAQALQRKLKGLEGKISEVHAIRLHRAISWLKASEEQEKNQDFRLISLWISCNSLYSMDEARFEALKERDRFAEFVDRLIELDSERRLYNLLWNKFSGSIRLLIENKFVYGPFWDFQRGEIKNWEKGFNQSVVDANNALSSRNVNYLLRIVLDRLYVLRNQIIHGGSTYKSKVNRPQVKDGANILSSLVPVLIEIMMENNAEKWGKVYYPPTLKL